MPLPCRPPSTNFDYVEINANNEIEQVEIPEFLVDFSKMFDFKMSQHMPFEKLSLEDSRVFQDILQKARYDKMYFPVYFIF